MARRSSYLPIQWIYCISWWKHSPRGDGPLQTNRSQSYGTGSNIFVRVSRCNNEKSHSHFHPLILTLEETAPCNSLLGYWLPTGAVTELSMDLGQPLQVMGYMVRLIDLMDLSPWCPFLFVKTDPWLDVMLCRMSHHEIRHSVIPQMVGADKGITGREDKSTSRMCLYSSEDKSFPLHGGRDPV